MKNGSRRSTRLDILHLLRQQELGVEALSKELSLTANAVRQHLASLEADGLVKAELRPSRHGRPHYVFSLTDASEELFPGRYEELVRLLLAELEQTQGQAWVDDLLARVARRRSEDGLGKPMTADERAALLRGLFEISERALRGEPGGGDQKPARRAASG
ncbi:MAG: helix-turn-helix transcriptional regulator [Candidatus Dormibacteria bacterium]